MGLKSTFAALSFSLVCLVPLTSSAATLKLVSTDNGIFPYNFSINGSNTLTALSCLNDTRQVEVGESWTVNVTNLATLATNAVIDGSSDLALREDAFLDALYNTGFIGANNTEIQKAIWDILDPSDYGSLDSKSKTLVTDAQGAAAGESFAFLSQFTLYTPFIPNGDYNPTNPNSRQNPDNWDGLGEPQQFLQYTPTSPAPTPEPSSLMLFGTGLVGVAGMMRRKIKAPTA